MCMLFTDAGAQEVNGKELYMEVPMSGYSILMTGYWQVMSMLFTGAGAQRLTVSSFILILTLYSSL